MDSNTPTPNTPDPNKPKLGEPNGGWSLSRVLARNQSYKDATAQNDIASLRDVPLGGNPHRIGRSASFRLFGFIGGIALVTVISILVAILLVFYRAKSQQSQKAAEKNAVKSQEVSTEDLSKVANPLNLSDPSRTLVVNSASIFNGSMAVKKDISIDGKIVVNGQLSVNGLNSTAANTLAATTVNGTLSVSGVTTLQGGANIKGNLSITGNENVSGDISANTITARTTLYSGNLTINGHLVTTPSTRPTASVNGAIAGGGSYVSITGNDTAGVITIHIGASPSSTSSGILANISFQTAYSAPGPKITLTPNGQSSSQIMYYVTQSLSGFSIGYNCRVFYGVGYYDPTLGTHCERFPQNSPQDYAFNYQVVQ